MIQRLCSLATLAVVCAAGANCQATLLNSWENDSEGWSIDQSAYSTAGFDTSIGVTDQIHSWKISGGPAGPNYGGLLSGPSTTGVTDALRPDSIGPGGRGDLCAPSSYYKKRRFGTMFAVPRYWQAAGKVDTA